MCVALFEPANTKVGTLKHIPRALTLGGHGHVSGVMWARIQAPGGQHAPSPVCTSEHLLCPQPCDGLPRRPGRWRQHTSPGPVRRGRRGGGGPEMSSRGRSRATGGAALCLCSPGCHLS